ncbi:MAG: general secretion pathway protein GspB [Methylococcaceae bacterium]
MSHTLKKLKQSEIEQGYRKPRVENKAKSLHGLFIACFTLTITFLLLLIIRGEVVFSKKKAINSKPVNALIEETPAQSASSKLTTKLAIVENQSDNKKRRKQKNKRTARKAKINQVVMTKENEVLAAKTLISQLDGLLGEEKLFKATAIDIETTNNTLSPSQSSANLSKTTNVPANKLVNKQETVRQNYVLPPTVRKTEVKPISPKEPQYSASKSKTETKGLNQLPAQQAFEVATNRAFPPSFENIENQPDQPEIWNELPISIQQSMPDMEVNGIVFYDKNEDRSVFINMRKYRINDTVEMGPTVQEINQNSVVMLFENRRFIISLPK